MKQSAKVKEATRLALAELSKMSRAEIDQALSARPLGAVGQLLLDTGTIETLLREGGSQWVLIPAEISMLVAEAVVLDSCGADRDVRYALSLTSSWGTMNSFDRGADVDISAAGVEPWAKAA